jgi:transcriptional regulator with XRE-family HTH domain
MNGTDLVDDTTSMGWRLRMLRTRRGLALVELAKATGLDISYLSRLERDALPNAKPKPDTINKVLDGLGASQSEREAVYHVERPQLTGEEIEAQVRRIAAQEFDRWYLDIVSRMYDFPWAAQLWENPRLTAEPLVIERQDMTLVNPIKGPLRWRLRMNRLMANPNFLVTSWTPLNRKSASSLTELRSRPEFDYDAVSLTASVLRRLPRLGEPPARAVDNSPQLSSE